MLQSKKNPDFLYYNAVRVLQELAIKGNIDQYLGALRMLIGTRLTANHAVLAFEIRLGAKALGIPDHPEVRATIEHVWKQQRKR